MIPDKPARDQDVISGALERTKDSHTCCADSRRRQGAPQCAGEAQGRAVQHPPCRRRRDLREAGPQAAEVCRQRQHQQQQQWQEHEEACRRVAVRDLKPGSSGTSDELAACM